jgi:hypothetical protein
MRSTELNRKPIAFVRYGGFVGQQLRLMPSNFRVASIRPALHIRLADFVDLSKEGHSFHEFRHLQAGARLILDELDWRTRVLRNGRHAPAGHD